MKHLGFSVSFFSAAFALPMVTGLMGCSSPAETGDADGEVTASNSVPSPGGSMPATGGTGVTNPPNTVTPNPNVSNPVPPNPSMPNTVAPTPSVPNTSEPGTGGQNNGGAGNAPTTGGVPGMGGEGGNTPVTGGGGSGTGGSEPGTGGTEPGTGAAGNGVGGGFVAGGAGGAAAVEPLDCGTNFTALENNGPPSNRLNYIIVGDGYSDADLQPGGALDQHLEAAMEKRFSDPIGQPYLRYRKFVNICVLRVASGPICGSSEFGCCGDDGSRLANCDNGSVNSAIADNISDAVEIDWRAVVLNGSSWWNSGGTLMMWSGGNQDAGGAALHEGGHGHNFISDEYGNCEIGRVSGEATYGVNVSLSGSDTDGKWEGWLGYNQEPGTGEQDFFPCDGGGTWRPTQNSMMNSLFGNDPDTSYNSVSREKIVMDIWRVVESPYDSVTPEEGAVTNPTTLTVNVIDPEVISVDWSLDGDIIAMDGGPSYNIAAANLAAGTYTVTARAYDNAGEDLVRQVPGNEFNRQYWGAGEMGHSDKTVTWTVTIP